MKPPKNHPFFRHFSIVIILAAATAACLGLLSHPSIKAHADSYDASMQFDFKFANNPIPITGANLLECGDQACELIKFRQAYTLECEANQCLTYDPELADNRYRTAFYKLTVQFADRSRQSNTFSRTGWAATYTVTVEPESLQVVEVAVPDPRTDTFSSCLFFAFLIFTIGVETIAAKLYSRFAKVKVRFWWVVAANIISFPIAHFIFPLLTFPFPNVNLAKLFVFLFEAAFLYYVGRKDKLSLKHAALLSFVMNASSYGLGLAIPAIIFSTIK